VLKAKGVACRQQLRRSQVTDKPGQRNHVARANVQRHAAAEAQRARSRRLRREGEGAAAAAMRGTVAGDLDVWGRLKPNVGSKTIERIQNN